MRTVVLAVAAAVALAAGLVGVASAAIGDGTLTLDANATMKPNGRAIVVTGSVQCDAGQRVKVTANPMKDPKALGRTSFACTGEVQSFELTVRMRGNGMKFSDMTQTQLFVFANTGDDVASDTVTVGW
jgi:hypothetical protein